MTKQHSEEDIVNLDIYADPNQETLKRYFDEMKTLYTPTKFQKFIEKVLPGWLLESVDDYSADYPHLKNNWTELCKKASITPEKIIIVKNIYFDKNHLLMHVICERLTYEGYVVRRENELQLCGKCGNAIPTEDVYKKMKEYNIVVPEKWSSCCVKCQL
jgi:hypothetical protein